MKVTKDNIDDIREWVQEHVIDDPNFCYPEVIGDSLYINFGLDNAYIVRIGQEITFDENNQIKII